MPDLRLYAAAIGLSCVIAAAGACLGFVPFPRGWRLLYCRLLSRQPHSRRLPACRFASWIGLAWLVVAVGVGWWVLEIGPRWPPRNGLDRLLWLVLPAAIVWDGLCVVMAGARFPRQATWSPTRWTLVAWALFAAAIVPTLLYGSVYLRFESSAFESPAFKSSADATPGNAWMWRGACWALLTAAVWTQREWLMRLERRTADGSVRFSLGITLGAAALLILFGGYLKGGAAALPVVGALLGGAWPRLTGARSIETGLAGPENGESASGEANDDRVLSLAVVALGGWLLVGVCFGNVGVASAVITWLSPLLAAVPAWLWPMRERTGERRWTRTALRIALVATPLAVVLTVAYREFERKYRPFTARESTPAILVWNSGERYTNANPEAAP